MAAHPFSPIRVPRLIKLRPSLSATVQASLALTAPAPDSTTEFAIFCSVLAHRQAGMDGTLISIT